MVLSFSSTKYSSLQKYKKVGTTVSLCTEQQNQSDLGHYGSYLETAQGRVLDLLERGSEVAVAAEKPAQRGHLWQQDSEGKKKPQEPSSQSCLCTCVVASASIVPWNGRVCAICAAGIREGEGHLLRELGWPESCQPQPPVTSVSSSFNGYCNSCG